MTDTWGMLVNNEHGAAAGQARAVKADRQSSSIYNLIRSPSSAARLAAMETSSTTK